MTKIVSLLKGLVGRVKEKMPRSEYFIMIAIVILSAIAIITGLFAGAGWGLYHNLKDSISKKPSEDEITRTSPTNYPNNYQNNYDDKGKIGIIAKIHFRKRGCN